MKILFYTVVASVVAVTSGCTAKLANRELGPEEKEWKEYIEPMYPGWKVPATLPPAVSDDVAAQNVNNDNDLNSNTLNDSNALSDSNNPFEQNTANSNSNTDDSLAGVTDKDSAGKVRYEDYVVQKDDTLSHIAQKVYGNGKKYYRIYKANEDIIKNPNRIYPGMTIKIPRP